MRAQPVLRLTKRALKVLVQRRLGAGLVVVGDLLVEDRAVTGLFQIGRDAEYKPGWIVVEARADVVVATLGHRLVLVVGADRGKLRRGDVENPIARALGDHVNEAAVSYTHLRAHETRHDLVCRLLLEKKKKK